MDKVQRLVDLNLFEVSLCGKGANAPAKIALFKMDAEGNDKESNMTKEEFDAAIPNITDDVMKGLVEHLQESKKEVDKQLEESKAEIETLKTSIDDVTKKEREEADAKKALDELPDNVKKALAEKEEAHTMLLKKAEEQEKRLVKIEQEKIHKELENTVSKYPRTISADSKEDMIKMLEGMTADQVEGVTKSWDQAEKIAGANESLFAEKGNAFAVAGSAAEKIQSLAEEKSIEKSIRIDVARVAVRKENPDLAIAEREESKGA